MTHHPLKYPVMQSTSLLSFVYRVIKEKEFA